MKKLFYVLVYITVVSCSADKRERPSNIPKSAIWKGGVDGGCWIEFKSVTTTSIEAVIFDENGDVWEKGIFKKNGNCKIAEDAIIEKIEGFDGERLFTNEYCSFKK